MPYLILIALLLKFYIIFMHTNKTELRKVLEELEDHIHMSWLKDLDKVKEFLQLETILEDILTKDSLEEFFNNNQSDFEYFINKFSHIVISNILRQPIIFGKNGDDVAFNILVKYLKIFTKYLHINKYFPLFDCIKEVFESNKSFYKGALIKREKNEKKYISAEKFNVKYLKINI